jgi:hypothetical protein
MLVMQRPKSVHRSAWARRAIISAVLLASMSTIACNPYTLRALRTDTTASGLDERRVVAHAIFVNNEGQPIEPRVGAKGRLLPGDQYRSVEDSVVFVQDTAYGRYLHALLESIRADSASHRRAPRLLLRIHGGMNTLNGSLDASVRMEHQIRADSATGYYPLFINWESGLTTSYLDHLLHIRRGQRKRWPGQDESLNPGNLEPFAAPLYLLADLAGGVVRAPLTTARQFGIFLHGKVINHQPELPYPPVTTRTKPRGAADRASLTDAATQAEASARTRPQMASAELALQHAEVRAIDSVLSAGERLRPGGETPHGRSIAFSRFAYERSRGEMIFHHGMSFVLSMVPTRYFVPRRSYGTSLGTSYRNASAWVRPFTIASWLPPKILGLIVLDGLGPPAWDTMRRRTKTMFRLPREFEQQQGTKHDAGQAVARYLRPTGAVSVFLDSLQRLVDSGPDYRITLVGHSMGAIVASEILRTRDSLPIDNVVFMASAATVREFEMGVVPYLERHPASRERQATQFYNLTLHALADQRERSLFGLAPYGSLLEWIDAYFANPETDLDRMFGKYDNALATAHIIPDSVRGNVHFKAFGYRSGKGCGGKEGKTGRPKDLPYRHGDFNDSTVAYWRSGFWKPGTAGCEEIKQSLLYVENAQH